MRPSFILLLVAGFAIPGYAAKRITVSQLESIVAAWHGKSDVDMAQRLEGLELRERLGDGRAATLEGMMAGPISRGVLITLVDPAAFLKLPPEDVPATAAPGSERQQELLKLAIAYAAQTLARLPNFFATRETDLFMDVPQNPARMTVPALQVLRFVNKFNATVLYRDGKQVVEADATKGKKADSSETGLITLGEFGPMLGTVLADAREGALEWSHWESRGPNELAVFRYAVSKEKSHYEATFCCVALNSGRKVFKQVSAYHGEIAIDPATGTILRITMQADLKTPYPMAKADLMVEYGQVEIGGKTYICPLKSIAIARVYERPSGGVNAEPTFYGSDAIPDRPDPFGSGPEILQTLLNHVVFRQYHLFRSETRILETGVGAGGADPGSAPNSGTANPVASGPIH